MHRELTVFQALYYTAKLRLPSGLCRCRDAANPAGARNAGYAGTEQVIIGSPERKESAAASAR
jgi:hypothetical protein